MTGRCPSSLGRDRHGVRFVDAPKLCAGRRHSPIGIDADCRCRLDLTGVNRIASAGQTGSASRSMPGNDREALCTHGSSQHWTAAAVRLALDEAIALARDSGGLIVAVCEVSDAPRLTDVDSGYIDQRDPARLDADKAAIAVADAETAFRLCGVRGSAHDRRVRRGCVVRAGASGRGMRRGPDRDGHARTPRRAARGARQRRRIAGAHRRPAGAGRAGGAGACAAVL